MSLIPSQQILELIKKSHHVLIVCPHNWNADCIASGLAWQSIINKMNTQTSISCDSFQPAHKIKFLPSINNIQPNISGLQQLIVSLDIKSDKINKLTHKIHQGKLNIFITPQDQELSTANLTSKLSNFKFDLICTLNAPDLESLGQIYAQHMRLFYHTPVINIDHQPNNENYGQINLVDLKSTSISETIFKLILGWDINLINEDIATCLLTGLYSKTWCFRSNTITPQTLNIAAQLVNLGAKREEIVHNLYQKKSLPVLKLWGKILSNLKQSDNAKLVWSTIAHHDFVSSGTNEKDLDGITEELISTTPQAESILLLYEMNSSKTAGILYTTPNHNALKLLAPYTPQGGINKATFTLDNTTLPEAEKEITRIIQAKLLN